MSPLKHTLLGILLFFVLACTSTQVQTQVDTTGPAPGQVLTYTGPKARIAVASFKCKAAKCSGQIGEGIADMLATALFRTGRFIVLERGEGLKAIQEELNLGQSGYVRPGAAPQIGQMEGADILVIGAITAFEPEASGLGGGGIVVPYKIPFLGGAKFKKKEAYIAADIRLVDVRTGRVIAATTVEGKASSWKVGGLMGGVLGDVALGGGLEAYKNTPLEKAVRVMLYNAVEAISRMVPENYYRWGENTPNYNQPPVASQPAASAAGGVSAAPKPSGAIIGAEESFKPGRMVLFKEDFSRYQIGDIPESMKLKGQAEVAMFSGKKWLRALSDKVILSKKIKLPANFAVEWTIYFSGSYTGMSQAFYLGPYRDKWESSEILHWASDWAYPRWRNQSIKTVKLQAGNPYHFAVQQRDGRLKIFVNGKRIYQEKVARGILGKLSNRDQITFYLGGANPAEGREILITDIVVTGY